MSSDSGNVFHIPAWAKISKEVFPKFRKNVTTCRAPHIHIFHHFIQSATQPAILEDLEELSLFFWVFLIIEDSIFDTVASSNMCKEVTPSHASKRSLPVKGTSGQQRNEGWIMVVIKVWQFSFYISNTMRYTMLRLFVLLFVLLSYCLLYWLLYIFCFLVGFIVCYRLSLILALLLNV